MLIGVPREIKDNEFRVALTPGGAHALVRDGHSVRIETGAGLGSGIADAAYEDAGAQIVPSADAAWDNELVLKVKEPIESEYGHFRDGLVLFTFLHLAAEPALTRALVGSGVTGIAYETVQLPTRALPLLAPMSEVAGRLAPIVGANAMMKPSGGPGLLAPGVPGTYPADVVIIGAGVAGTNAMNIAVGLGADVTILDTNLFRLREIDDVWGRSVRTIASNEYEIARAVARADLVIGSVLIPGAKAPKLVTDAMVAAMKPGSVLVDIAIDQGGCFEGSRATTHSEPMFRVHDSLFYCVANMPGAVPVTSTYALTNATLSYARSVAAHGWRAALRADPALALGLNTHAGAVTNEAVAAAHGLNAIPLADALA